MNWTKEAIEMMKKFASRVDCPWDKSEDTIEQTMFHCHCKEIAEKMGKTEIDEKVARVYILKKHNPITVETGRKLKESDNDIINCMVLPKKVVSNWICVHGGADLFPISKKEARVLEKEIQRLLEGLQ